MSVSNRRPGSAKAPDPKPALSTEEDQTSTRGNFLGGAAGVRAVFAQRDTILRQVARKAQHLPHVEDIPHGPTVYRNQTPQQKAEALEQRDGAHSLGRHGPGVSDQQLKDRLTTGVAADGAFSPAVNDKGEGASTKFASHEAYLETRAAAVAALDTAITKTKGKMQGLLDSMKVAQDAFDKEPSGAGKGQKSKDLAAAQKAVSDGAAAVGGGEVPCKAVPKDSNPANRVLMRASYEVVLDHGKPIGSGFKAEGGAATLTQVQNPNDKNKTGNATTQVGAVPAITKTRTTFDTGGGSLLTAGSAEAMKAAQHFPAPLDAPGIR